MQHERQDDLPPYLKWVMTFINRVGFPILVCMWLAYQQFVSGRETVQALHDFKEVMLQVKDSIDNQTRTLKRTRTRNDD
jgi:hypothetical protein